MIRKNTTETRTRRTPAAGFSLLGFMLVVFGLTVVGIVVATNLLGRVVDRNQAHEERALIAIRRAFILAVSRTQTIPTYTNWQAVLAPFAGLNSAGLGQAHPDWGTDSTLNRAFLVDPNLPSSLLPYVQPVGGLAGSATNLLGSAARILIVSGTKRGLALPVSSGVPASNTFNAIWAWQYDPATKAPPSGWTGWTGAGDFLHVERINLASLFHEITFENLKFGQAGLSSVTNLISAETTFHFLQGTALVVAETNGAVKATHVVSRTAAFDFAPATNNGPLLYYKFSETSGTVATNSGWTGSSANGTHTSGVYLGLAGPRPPTYVNYSSGNVGAYFDGYNDYVRGTNGLLNNVSAFTILGWIRPYTYFLWDNALFGQEDVAEVGFGSSWYRLELRCNAGSQILTYSYPYGFWDWHHIAAVGNGTNMYLYVDATLVASKAYTTSSYGSSAKNFNVGGNVFGTGSYFPGMIDEVMVYDRALSAAELSLSYSKPRATSSRRVSWRWSRRWH